MSRGDREAINSFIACASGSTPGMSDVEHARATSTNAGAPFRYCIHACSRYASLITLVSREREQHEAKLDRGLAATTRTRDDGRDCVH